jgi:hypothetical protein
VDPCAVKFKFAKGDLVRPKLLVISSATVGKNRSAQSLANTLFVVDKLIAYTDQKHSVGRSYRCVSVDTGEVQFFDEKDIALSREVERSLQQNNLVTFSDKEDI